MRFSENAVPWTLFALVTVALVVVLANMNGFTRSAVQGDRWQQWAQDAESEQKTRQIYQDRIDELEERLEKCGCH